MVESDYEKIRNHLTIFSLILDTVKMDSNYQDKDSLVEIALDDMEEIKVILNRMERENRK